MSLLNSKVLVLNRSYLPIHITSVRRALVLLYQNVAHAVDDEYRTFDYAGWADLAPVPERIGLVRSAIRVPRVILLLAYDRLPRRYVRFSRHNIYLRDRNRCQYCNRQYPRSELNLDHVIPRSRGGKSLWENVVCSCHRCNRLKGGRMPAEAGMRLARRPYRPQWTPFVAEAYNVRRYREWLPFLHGVDGTYVSTELAGEFTVGGAGGSRVLAGLAG
jgi:5-methylcytosine-specific restriction endonuclease McrA